MKSDSNPGQLGEEHHGYLCAKPSSSPMVIFLLPQGHEDQHDRRRRAEVGAEEVAQLLRQRPGHHLRRGPFRI